MKIGFFGGCFNPPSNIHIDIAKKVLKENNLDRVIFVPVGDSYEKNELVEARHRYNMLKLAIQKYKNIEIDDIELNINRKLYAIDIFKLLENKYNKHTLYFIMGSDNFEKMSKWKEFDKLKKYNYIVVERNKQDINATEIRDLIREGRDMSVFLNEGVYKYIKENDLYRRI